MSWKNLEHELNNPHAPPRDVAIPIDNLIIKLNPE